jgi:hypothetical protein
MIGVFAQWLSHQLGAFLCNLVHFGAFAGEYYSGLVPVLESFLHECVSLELSSD